MRTLIGLLLVVSMPAFATNDIQRRCYIDTNTNTTASGVGVLLIVASANRSCLFISNKDASLKVYANPIASTSATNGIEIMPNTTFAPVIVPTNGFILHTTGAAANVTIESGYQVDK